MKKILPIAAVLLCAVLMMCACGQAPASSALPEGFLEGTVQDANLSGLVVADENGRQYLFAAENAKIEGADALQQGDSIRLFYKGTLAEGQNMQPVTVERIEVLDGGTAGLESPVSGTVVDATMNTITIETTDGKTFSFGTEDAVVEGEGGILLGAEVTIYFEGTLDESKQQQDVKVGTIEVTKAGGPPQNPNPSVDYIAGTVSDATMNSLEIETIYGEKYRFDIDGVPMETAPSGLVLGETVAVYYTGALVKGSGDVQPVTVTKLSVVGGAPSQGTNVVASTPEGEVKVIEGTIDVVDAGTFMMSDATGVEYLFSIEGAVIQAGSAGLQVGDYVSVYYIGTVAGSPDVQPVTVTQVVVHH